MYRKGAKTYYFRKNQDGTWEERVGGRKVKDNRAAHDVFDTLFKAVDRNATCTYLK